MKLVTLGSGVLNQTPFDWVNNTTNIEAMIAEARQCGVAILCLPELCITGYGCEDMFLSSGLQQRALETLQQISNLTSNIVCSVGLPIFFQGNIYNAVALLADGNIIGVVPKRFLAGDGIHYEPRWFKAWPEGKIATLQIGEKDYPIGDLIFDCGGIKIGFEICEDAWAAKRPGASLAARGADIILNPSASHFAFEKFEIRKRFVLEGSRAFGVAYVYSNLLGNESGRAIYDGGALIAASGKLVAQGPRFRYTPTSLLTATIDLDSVRSAKSVVFSNEPDQESSVRGLVSCKVNLPKAQKLSRELMIEPWEASMDLKFEEFTRAECLGLYDYGRKSRSRGFVVSMSGGADSATVATLVYLMVHLAAAPLGVASVAKNFGLDLEISQSPATLVRSLLTTVYQATKHSSTTTRDAAKKVSQAIGARFFELDVEEIAASYRKLIAGAIERDLDWSTDDITLQNIQARVRAPSVWMLANINRALLLTTSNRSEAAVGYATMDGDTAGGLAPLGGIDKAFIRKWLKWIEQKGIDAVAPISALKLVNDQVPTAELRPEQFKQTDEDDLMPYAVLDRIERAAILDRQTPVEIYHRLSQEFADVSCDKIGAWIERFFKLWCANQWKRERYAPSFHLDDENLDPRSWCRFPILSGGFELELVELKAEIERSKREQG